MATAIMQKTLLCKSMGWFLYGNGLHHKRVNDCELISQ